MLVIGLIVTVAISALVFFVALKRVIKKKPALIRNVPPIAPAMARRGSQILYDAQTGKVLPTTYEGPILLDYKYLYDTRVVDTERVWFFLKEI